MATLQQTPPARPKSDSQKENTIKQTWDEIVRYFKGVNSELKRVTWPTRQELRYNTVIVVLVVIGISLYMWLVDQGITILFRLLHRT